MPDTLATFHFNTLKIGHALHEIAKEQGYGCGKLSTITGISRDSIWNIFHGVNQEISFEKLFKLCHALHTPMVVIEMLALDGVDADFVDKVLYYDPSDGAVLPSSDVDISQLPVDESVIAAVEAASSAEVPVPPPHRSDDSDQITFLRSQVDRLTHLLELSLKK